MAVTNGWGQAAKNNTNDYGKLATNNIGAGSIYENSYAGDTALIGVSAAFSYSASSFTQADSNPTPTITGNTGGTFSGTSGLVFVSTSTGEINLSASTIAAHVVTYTVDGVSSDFSLSVVSPPYASTRSFSFDGVNDYFDCGSASYLNGVTQCSISLWINLDTAASSKTPLSTWNYGLSPRGQFAIQTDSSSGSTYGLRFWTPVSTTDNNGVARSTGNVFNENTWHHLVIAYNAGAVQFYKDGSAISSTGSGSMPTSLVTGDGRLYIGQFGGLGRYWSGNIDEVSIWDSALSSDAVTEIYNSGAPNDLTSLTNASSSNLVAWYKMGE